MKRLFLPILISILVFNSFQLFAQELKFDKDGNFKIVQFTDLHYKSGVEESQKALECFENVLEEEKPDFIIITGDLVYSTPAEKALYELMEPVIASGIPYAIVWGNHDSDFDLTREQIRIISEKLKGNLSRTEKGVSGESNFVLTVKSYAGDKDAAILYCLDSHSYSQMKPLVSGYSWFEDDQIDWYKSKRDTFIEQNGGKVLPSMAFFHIALPEYNQAAADENTILYGNRWEAACAPKLNTGMFKAMLEKGDVMATFVGHDHDNDYVCNWYGMILGYGRFSGGNTEYHHLPINGARVIVLQEGSNDFESWIRLRDGQKILQFKKSQLLKRD